MIEASTPHRWRATRTRALTGPAALVILGMALAAAFGMARAANSSAAAPQAGQADPPVVAVADFYALGPPPIFTTDPERFAADDLTEMLARVGGTTVTLVPRTQVLTAEGSLNWRTWDALKFARLSALAQAVHANRLVVGWLSQVSVDTGGGGPSPHVGRGAYTGFAGVNVQVFDAAQGRIIWERKAYGNGMGLVADIVLRQSLDDALERTVRPALAIMSAPLPSAVPASAPVL